MHEFQLLYQHFFLPHEEIVLTISLVYENGVIDLHTPLLPPFQERTSEKDKQGTCGLNLASLVPQVYFK